MSDNRRTRRPISDELAVYDRLVEVGIGHRTDLAAALVRTGATVTATDLLARTVPDGVEFVVDDVTDPTPAIYEGADAIYARRLPPELHRPTWELARRVDADCLFTTLGGDPPMVPVERRTVAEGTLFVARDGPC